MAMAILVTATTSFVAGFRYMIAVWERNGREEVQRRQPEWDALAARAQAESKKK